MRVITFKNLCQETPYLKIKEKYDEAVKSNQKIVEAISISSFSYDANEVNSRYVNLKFIENNEFIFFSNYNSPKSNDFDSHDQISAIIFWNSINVQIRMKAKIKKTPSHFNKSYFKKRDPKKNALAISSNQSQPINSYNDVLDNYNKVFETHKLDECPEYWGGFSFRPYYIEFWEGRPSRLNTREAYTLKNNDWILEILQP